MRVLLVLLLLVSSAFADVTRYVRTDCANNGDGTASSCAASPGAAGAYTTCANAESDIQSDYSNNIDTANTGVVTIDAAGTAADGTCVFSGITTSAADYVRLYVDQANRHDGKWNTSKYRITSSGIGITVNIAYLQIIGVQAESTGSGSGNYGGIANYGSTSGINTTIKDSIVRFVACSTGGGGACYGIYLEPGGANPDTTYVINNIVYGDASTSIKDVVRLQNASASRKIVIYGNTLRNGDNCLVMYDGGASDALYMKNNVLDGCATENAFFSAGNWTTLATATNVTQDTTSPDAGGRSKTCSYTNTTFATMDLHLQSGDTNCQNAGTDLSTDASSQYSYSTDIDGATRSGTWDIGADEYSNSTNFFAVLNAMGEL
jgi:hypothetical protein